MCGDKDDALHLPAILSPPEAASRPSGRARRTNRAYPIRCLAQVTPFTAIELVSDRVLDRNQLKGGASSTCGAKKVHPCGGGSSLPCDAVHVPATPWAGAPCAAKATVLLPATPTCTAVPKAPADYETGMARKALAADQSQSVCGMALMNTAWTGAAGIFAGHRRGSPKGVASLALSPRFL